MLKKLNFETDNKEFIAYPWPDYKKYMSEDWFLDECYYCADKDVYFIPEERCNENLE